jgi:ankyrin repeat protein
MRTALHGNWDVVNVLIDLFKDPEEVKDTCGTTPLMDAVRSGHVEIARRLVDAKVCSCECRDGMGMLSIHLAAQVHANTLTGFPFFVSYF